MKSILRRCLALALVLALSLSGSVTAFAASYDDIVSAELTPDFENAVVADQNGDFESVKNGLESIENGLEGIGDEKVVFIVELEGDAILDTMPGNVSAGEYLTTFAGENDLNAIRNDQEVIEDRILFCRDYKFTLVDSYQIVMNGIAVSGPYAAKDYLESLSGVKSVSVANEYDAPDPITTATYTAITSGAGIKSDAMNDLGYTGKGTVTAIIDTGLDVNHEAFQKAPEDPALDIEDIRALVDAQLLKAAAYEEDLYKSAKVPFAYDYFGLANDTDVTDVQQHGTHVAGTVGADCDNFKGVAPDTQLVILKVFGDTGGATDTDIFNALEDAVLLGVDAINMSLGAPCGFTYEGEAAAAVYARVKEAGISLMVAAGNEENSVVNTKSLYGLAKASEPDTGIVGSSSTYPEALSVASINEPANYFRYIMAGDVKINFNDANSGADADFVAAFDGQDVEFVVIPGVGAVSDFEGIDATGKIALIQRGELAFTEKELNAYNAGAIGMIIYDNVEGTLGGMIVEGIIPSIMITLADGEYLKSLENKVISVSYDFGEFVAVPDAGLMSDFSSIGPAPDLSLKPEITAPGGYVYSTLPGGIYGSMSGTSMATPHMAGAAAVLRQYVDEEFSGLSEIQKQEFINTLFMNTAEPVLDANGAYYSVRKQGAGLANVTNAIFTQAIVTVDGSERPKAELGYNEEGVYSFDLTLYNFGEEALSYNLSSVTLCSAFDNDGYDWYMFENQLELVAGEDVYVEFSEDTVTVAAGDSASVSVTIELADSTKELYDQVFTNGNFVEGFITLESANEDEIDLSVPYLGFYGDWADAPIFDDDCYSDEYASVNTGLAAKLNPATGSGYYLGVNLRDYDDDGVTDYAFYSPDRIAYSYESFNDDPEDPGDEAMLVPYFAYGFLRSSPAVLFNIYDDEDKMYDVFSIGTEGISYYVGGVLMEYVQKSFYYAAGGFINTIYGPTNNGWFPVEAIGEDLYFLDEGQYYIEATAVVDGTGGQVQSRVYPIYLDYTAPELLATRYDEEGGEHYVTLALRDNHYIKGFILTSADVRDAYTIDIPADDMVECQGDLIEVTINVTSLVEAGIESARVYAYDYADNYYVSHEFSTVSNTERARTLNLDSDDLAYVKGGESFIIEAYIEPTDTQLEKITWTSSDERVATIEGIDTRYDEETGRFYYRARVTTADGIIASVKLTATTEDGLSDSTIMVVYSMDPIIDTDPGDFPGSGSSGSQDSGSDDSKPEILEREDDETNPETGASVNGISAMGAVAVLAALAVAAKKSGK